MLDGAVVIPLQSLFWNLLFEVAALLWMVDRALLSVGYFILTLTGWMSQNVFAPLLAVVSDQTGVLVGPIFLVALTVLGFTYLMAVFGRFEVVNLRSAVLWLLFAAALYTFGPNIYTGMEDFRRFVGGGFYQLGVDAFNDASSATGLNAIGTLPSDNVPVPTDQFGQFLPGVPGASAVDGLDVAMSYVGADGYDVLAASGSPHPIARLPWLMVEDGADGFFDPDTGPNAFPSMTDADRQASIGRALQGLWRAFTTLFIAIFGIIEQLVNFLMACSFAVAFFSMFIAVLFGFFVRTETIAWSALNLIIELFIQSIINSLLMSLVLGFVMVGANTGNAILLLGASLVGLWMSWNLLQGCIKGLMNSTERLYTSFSASTGGNFATVGETNKTIAEGAASAATGVSVLAGGGSFLQSLGATFGDSRTAQTMNYASRMLGGEETLLGSMAQSIGEGASARSLAGPLGGYLLGKQSKTETRQERDTEKRRRYIGENDEARDASLNRYLETGSDSDLEQSFAEEDIPRVQALADAYEPEDFDRVVTAVRRVRNDNPGISPQSPTFMGKLRQELPSPLREMEAPALEDFATVFGAAADASPYLEARDFYTPPVVPSPRLGNADFERDDAVAAYRQAQSTGQSLPNLEDAFSPDDANRLAQLMDAYDDDDFAQVVYAVRAAREAHPDAQAGSSQVLQASRKNLPPTLQKMPSRDLAAFSRAFGASASHPAIADETPKTYLGAADRDRDLLVDSYRDGDENAEILEQGFSRRSAEDVAILANEYERDDFDAVVRAVRQARTADPDLEAGSAAALRATRKLLPEHLRQMPSTDLSAFSSAFGTAADTASIPSRSRAESPRNRRFPRPQNFAQLNADDDALSESSWILESDDSANITEPVSNTNLPSTAPSSVPEQAVSPQGTALQPMRGLGTVRIQRLAEQGISTLEALRDAQPALVAAALRVGESQVQAWQQEAQVLLTTGSVAAASGAGLMTAAQSAASQQNLPNPSSMSMSSTSPAAQVNPSQTVGQPVSQPQVQPVNPPIGFNPVQVPLAPISTGSQPNAAIQADNSAVISSTQTAANLSPAVQPNAAAVSNPPANFAPAHVPLNPANSAPQQRRPSNTVLPANNAAALNPTQTAQTPANLSANNQANIADASNPPANFAPAQVPVSPANSMPQQGRPSDTSVPVNNSTAINAAQTAPSPTSLPPNIQPQTGAVSNPAANTNPTQMPLNPTAQQTQPKTVPNPPLVTNANPVPNAPASFTAQSQVPSNAPAPKPVPQKAPLTSRNVPENNPSQFSNSLPAAPGSEGNSRRLSPNPSKSETFSESPKPASEENLAANNPADEEASE